MATIPQTKYRSQKLDCKYYTIITDLLVQSSYLEQLYTIYSYASTIMVTNSHTRLNLIDHVVFDYMLHGEATIKFNLIPYSTEAAIWK